MEAAACFAAYRFSAKIVFQLVLTFVLFAAVLVSSIAWSMHQRRGLVVPVHARRVLMALERATNAAVRRRAVRIPLVAAVCLTLLITTQHLLPNSRMSATAAIGSILAYTLGIFAVLGLTVFCGHHVRKHAFLSVASASSSLERSLSVTISGVALLAIGAEVFGVSLAALVHGTVTWLSHVDPAPSDAVGLSHFAVGVSTYFGVGAVVASMALQQAGAVCVGANKLAGEFAFDCRTSLSANDPRNPSVLSDAMSWQLGSVVPRILDAFVGGALATAISFQIAAVASSSAGPKGIESAAMLPLLVRAFGLLATLVALLTLRTSEHEDQRKPLIRSQVVAHVVLGSALAGLIVWLLGSLTITFVSAAAIGLLITPALGRFRAHLFARSRVHRTTNDDLVRQGSLPAVESAVTSLGAMLGPMLLLAVVLGFVCLWLGRAERFEPQSLIALVLGLSTPSSLGTLGLIPGACRDFGAIGTLAATVGRVSLSDEALIRLRKATEAFDRASIAANPLSSDSGALACGLAAVVCQATHLGAPPIHTSVVLLLCIGLLVVIPSVLAAFECFRASTKATRTQLSEIDRQLRGMRRTGRTIVVPEDFVPSYRSCVELLARDSAQGGLLFTLAAIAFPALIAHLGRIPENSAGSASLSLASYAAIAAAVGLLATHVGHAASAASMLAPGGNWFPRVALASPAVPVSESLRMIEFLGHSMSVSVPLLTKAVALVTLIFAASLA